MSAKPIMTRHIFVFLWLYAAILQAAQISGTVEDESHSPIRSAQIEIAGTPLASPITLQSDAHGHFVSPDLHPGAYSVKISAANFSPVSEIVNLSETNATLTISLDLPTLTQEVTVDSKVSGRANTDPIYRQLRDINLGLSYSIKETDLKYDAATFHLSEGTLTFISPVNGMVTGAIFLGRGHFSLKPGQQIDQQEILRRVHAEQIDEDVSAIVFRYTGDANRSLLAALKQPVDQPAAAAVFNHWKESVRRRHEFALGLSDSILNGSDMLNADADLLSWIYNPVPEHSLFQAYMHGSKNKDLRFFARSRGGAMPGFSSPEEISLINFDPGGMDDGVWYLSHRQSEFRNGTASSLQERRFVAARKFKVETVLGNNDHLTSIATVTFEPLLEGERVIHFNLLPNLRVSRVTDAHGQELFYIQENRKADGSLYVILPQPAALQQECSITLEYAGDKVVTKAGNGSFYIGAREAWYPNLNDFQERALYDLTFRVPKRFRLISVGDLTSEGVEDNEYVTHWITPKPVALAGFNYGAYKKVELRDEKINTTLTGFYLPELPDTLSDNPAVAGMAPGSMTKYVLDQARAELEVCTYFFGNSSFHNLAITEQPNFNFGQSWPTLVYLPISAYIDSTQRWLLFGRINNRFTAFVQEVTPHEVAHQWWGHAVGWASYHDQWLSEGFAEFSAGLFLQQAVGEHWQKDYVQFWDRLKQRVMDKNQFGISPNDAGPIWLGTRLDSPRSRFAYQNNIYPKGAFILAMLRSVMWSNRDHDKAFIDMMHDFVESHATHAASTETFKVIAEKHMPPAIDFQHNGKLDWFFNEWVYGTQVPRYQFDYQISPALGGKTKLHATITQSEVTNSFVMAVPIYADYGKGFIRLTQLPIVGNTTQSYDLELAAIPNRVTLNAFKEILER